MSLLKQKLFLACESFLRVPPLLLIDEIFRTSFGLGGKLFNYGGGGSSSTKSIISSGETFIVKSAKPSSENVEELSLSNLPPSPSELPPEVNKLPDNNDPYYWNFLVEKFIGGWTYGQEVLDNTTDNLRSNVQFVQNATSTVLTTTVATKAEEAHVGVEEFAKLTEEFAGDLMILGEVGICLFLFFAAVIMFMLATDNLIKLYSYILSFLSLYVAYIISPLNIHWELMSIFFLSANITFRTVLIAVFYSCWTWTRIPGIEARMSSNLERLLIISLFLLPGFMNVPPAIFMTGVVVLHHPLIMSLPKVYNFLMQSWGETKRVQNEYGLSHLIQVESGRLRVNTVFRLFWIARAAYDAFYRCCDEPAGLIAKYVMIHGTETFTGIIGMTTVVAAICHQIGDILLWLLYWGANSEVDLNRFGSISTVLFFILSLQSGLTSLDPEKRLDRLMKNIALLGTALFHALHQLVAPLLHAFRTFQAVQIRAALISGLFLVFSFCLTFSLLRWSTISTWSLAVLALAIEFKIKVVISLIISAVVYLSQLVQYPDFLEKFVSACRRIMPRSMLHFFDQLYDQVSHEDMVFYLKTVANVAEFVTGIFLFLNAVWIFLFESTSAIRAIGMSIHAYFNIWCEAQKGFRIYCQRKTASKKIMSLKDATDEQLRSRSDDVCSICYEGFESAKVTNCGHLFHAVCLRKWLYVQNTCPMCHEILYKEETTEEIPEEPLAPEPPAFRNNLNNGNVEAMNGNGAAGGRQRHPAGNHRAGAGPGGALRLRGEYDGVQFYDIDVDGHETDIEDNNDEEEFGFDMIAEDSSGSEVDLQEALEVVNREFERGRFRDDNNDGGDEGGVQAANGRGLVLFL